MLSPSINIGMSIEPLSIIYYEMIGSHMHTAATNSKDSNGIPVDKRCWRVIFLEICLFLIAKLICV